MTAEFPERLRVLWEPHRYKVLWGGRGGSKSWNIGRWLVIDGVRQSLRILCTRETQKSIGDSVHRLLADQIQQLNLGYYYSVEKAKIYGPNGTEFIFAGLKHDPGALKSYEGCDRCWVEEAQNVSSRSWDILIPTIRKPGSEIVVSFNPDLESDATYQRFVVNPPPDSAVVKVGWEDNPWFPDVLRKEMEHCKATDIDAWHHIWQGHCVNILKGAVYAAQLRDVDSQGRVTRVPYDPQRPVNTFWDLGVDDSTSIWFVQAFPMGEYRIIDYLEGSGEGLPYYLKELQQRQYVYGTHYLPHDGRARQLGTGKSIEELMRVAGMRVQIVPKLSVADGINAARTIFPNCWFDGDKCKDGLQALRHYRYGEKEDLGVKTKEPVHDWASHASDAFRYFAVGVRTPKPPQQTAAQRPRAPLSAWS